MEQRVDALEKASVLNAAQVLAMDCLLRAIVATHPDRAVLLEAFQRISAELQQRMTDVGFDTELPPENARTLIEPFEERVQHWSAWLTAI